MAEQIVLSVNAKINLSLDITGKRADGYHTLRSVFQNVDISDRLIITKTAPDQPLTLECSDERVPCDRRNLIWKAAEALLGEDPKGIRIRLWKDIPMQAGMGGGSADCAAALLGIRALLSLPVSDKELLEIAVKLGADVPFFLVGGTVLCEGIGEVMTKLPDVPRHWLVIAKGQGGISTPEAYRRLDGLTSYPPACTEDVLAHLQEPALYRFCGNAFDLVTDHGQVELIRSIMKECRIKPVLSGSGAAVFGGCDSVAEAETCCEKLAAKGFRFVRIAEPMNCAVTANIDGERQKLCCELG